MIPVCETPTFGFYITILYGRRILIASLQGMYLDFPSNTNKVRGVGLMFIHMDEQYNCVVLGFPVCWVSSAPVRVSGVADDLIYQLSLSNRDNFNTKLHVHPHTCGPYKSL